MYELAERDTGAAVLPALIARAGERGAWRFVEFFTVNIRNRNTRAAYARAAAVFLRWCEGQGITRLQDVQPVQVAAYIEQPGNVSALGKATSRLYPHAVRLAGNRPGDAVEPRALSPRAVPFG